MIHIPGGVCYDKVVVQAALDVSAAYTISVADGWLHKERFLDTPELIYVTEGALHLQVGSDRVSLSAGDAYLIRSYTTLAGQRPSVGPCSFYTVSFSCTLKKYDVLFGRILRLSSRASYAETLLTNLSFYGDQQQGSNHLMDASFALLLEVLYDSRNPEPERLQMQGLIRYIDENLSSALLVEDISAHFHYNSDYITKIFRQQFGTTIKQYIIEKRLAMAKRLLANSDLPICAVGESVGFSDQVLFEKFFRYHTKMTPRKYRNQHL